jgi:hypothetical protein
MAHPGACATATTTVELWQPPAAPRSGHGPAPTHEQTIRDQLRVRQRSCPCVGERAPQRAALTAQLPAGLVRDQFPRAAQLGEQLLVGQPERDSGAGQDPRAKQLRAQLDGIAARDRVTDRERGERLQPGERAPGDLPRPLAAAPGPEIRAAQPLAVMLDHADREPYQLLDLVARGRPHRHLLTLAEHVSAPTCPRPVLNDLIARPARQPIPALALMPGLRALLGRRVALLAPRRLLCQADRSRRTRRIPRVLRHLPLQPLHPRGQLPTELNAHPRPRVCMENPSRAITQIGPLALGKQEVAGSIPAGPTPESLQFVASCDAWSVVRSLSFGRDRSAVGSPSPGLGSARVLG